MSNAELGLRTQISQNFIIGEAHRLGNLLNYEAASRSFDVFVDVKINERFSDAFYNIVDSAE